MLDRLLKWLEIPIHAFLWLGLAAGFLMMMHVTVDVGGRGLLNRPLDGTTEIVAAYYMVAIAYLPWAYIARNDGHLVAGIFQRIGTARFDFWLEIAVKILTALYVSAFVYQTFRRALQQTQSGEVWLAGTIYIPVWPCRWLLPISGALMVLYLVVRIASDIARGPEARA